MPSLMTKQGSTSCRIYVYMHIIHTYIHRYILHKYIIYIYIQELPLLLKFWYRFVFATATWFLPGFRKLLVSSEENARGQVGLTNPNPAKPIWPPAHANVCQTTSSSCHPEFQMPAPEIQCCRSGRSKYLWYRISDRVMFFAQLATPH